MNLNQVNHIISSIPKNKTFEFTVYFNSNNSGDNKSNGRWFKENVKNGNIPHIIHKGLNSARHDIKDIIQ